MQPEYFIPENKEMMEIFLGTIEQGDRIPLGLVGYKHGILSEEELTALPFLELSETKADNIRKKTLNLGGLIKSYFRRAYQKSIEVRTSGDSLVILDDDGVVAYTEVKFRRVKTRFRQWYRSLRDANYVNLSEENKFRRERLMFENAETYRQFSEKSKKFTMEPPQRMERPLPNIKAKHFEC